MLSGHIPAETLGCFTNVGLLRTKEQVDKDLQAEVVLQIYLGFLQFIRWYFPSAGDAYVLEYGIMFYQRTRGGNMEAGE